MKKMFNCILKKIIESKFLQNICKQTINFQKKIIAQYNLLDPKIIFHSSNLFILFFSYTISNVFLYDNCSFLKFFKEIFSLTCFYFGVFILFVDKINYKKSLKIIVCVNTFFAPMFFLNTSIFGCFLCLALMIFIEFIILEYMRGSNFFSSSIHAYFICESIEDAETILNIKHEYNILELIILNNCDTENPKISILKSITDITNRLKKYSHFPFLLTPKRIIYFTKFSKKNKTHIHELTQINSEFSISIFYGHQYDSNKSILNIYPVSFLEHEESEPQNFEKNSLTNIFKNKDIWICFDGRQIILDLIVIFAHINSIKLTLFCESEKAMVELKLELSSKCTKHDYIVKIIDTKSLCSQTNKPDVLFYNMQIKSIYSGEDNLKEAVVKNVLETNDVINFAKNKKIPLMFVMSSKSAINTNNWIGATQRLGELFTQFADFNNRKTMAKFRIIRIPNCAIDKFGIFGQIINSIKDKGYIDIDCDDSDASHLYNRNEILDLLIKTIIISTKTHDDHSCVYTIIPKKNIELNEVIDKSCNMFGLKKNIDIPIIVNKKHQNINLDSFPNIEEKLHETSIPNVWRTNFAQNIQKYEIIPTLETINKMTTRELISEIFQSIREKIKSK